ncbi:collagen alpha-1(XV) chain-like [Tachypleus tridentatus]|uniref:collagen alpha-1(XV) chain-like n=1 Tax=Tachypleus tridentatus TaxID=6853 RepID=UPI003FD18D64
MALVKLIEIKHLGPVMMRSSYRYMFALSAVILVVKASSLDFLRDELLLFNETKRHHFDANYIDRVEYLDLLETIHMPFISSSVKFINGLEGLPAFKLGENTEIRAPYRLFLPRKMFSNFSILATVKPEHLGNTGGFLFAVVNPSETVVQLGIKIMDLQNDFANVSFYYTDVARHVTSQVWASFTVPDFIGSWAKIALRVNENKAQLYFQCEDYGRITSQRIPKVLEFDSASTLYVGQAGQLIGGRFVLLEATSCERVFVVIS